MALVVVITGASSGIGRALALSWAKRGASVVLSARGQESLERVAAEVRAAGGEALAVAGDVTVEEDRKALCDRALGAYGRLDVLVNNAGRGYYVPTVEIDPAELEAIYRLNVVAPMRLAQLAIAPLSAAKGTVVMISSIAGIVSAPRMGAYASSKFALEALSMSLRAEVSSRGVRVLVVRPGPVATPFHANAVVTDHNVGYRPPGHREQSPEEVAEGIVRAVEAGREVLETSVFVKAASLAVRVAPGPTRWFSKYMARRSGL
ncbi:SDR family NAD(P)-dependent oxidoreductase [Sorangium cellulosum]|uniref:3-oxoacyl-ACP reductase n=1 Tax=Sorangium cellulosum TaxID=56 RepID=A0A150Q740_SORCE|nr:SDR family NAD(P)-dependent oxidoreductase [Sorangium cellulosum]KYF63468.1 3-oxoacyl-ACP reductase [Sorangium cellulosum]